MDPNGMCGICRWYDPDDTLAGTHGQCRKSPPMIDMIPIMETRTDGEHDADGGIYTETVSIDQVDITRRGVWPTVAADDWCGDFVLPHINPEG